MTQLGLAVPRLTRTHQAAQQEVGGCPPLSNQAKYSSEPTTTRRRLSTRLSARALELKATQQTIYVQVKQKQVGAIPHPRVDT